MSELIIIAGPQAAGKSTAIINVHRQYCTASLLVPKTMPFVLFPLQESRQIVAHKHMLLGAIFMSLAHEREVVGCDFHRMNLIVRRAKGRLMYLDECNVFTVAHAAAHGIKHIERYFESYLAWLEKLSAKVIFLDIPPDISWERRRAAYEQRLIYFAKRSRAKILARYRDYLERTYPLLRGVYERIPFPKRMIDARMSEYLLTETVSKTLALLSSSFT